MTVYRVTYGAPFPGWRDFTDHAQATAFAHTAVAEDRPEITIIPAATEETNA